MNINKFLELIETQNDDKWNLNWCGRFWRRLPIYHALTEYIRVTPIYNNVFVKNIHHQNYGTPVQHSISINICDDFMIDEVVARCSVSIFNYQFEDYEDFNFNANIPIDFIENFSQSKFNAWIASIYVNSHKLKRDELLSNLKSMIDKFPEEAKIYYEEKKSSSN